MLKVKDESIVRAYARSGMHLDVLIKSFPQFTKEDVTYAYLEEFGLLPASSYSVRPAVSK